jgi:hypothetical protein
VTMPLPENEGVPVNRARAYGAASAIGGVVLLFLSLYVPNQLADKVAKCNTVAGDMYARSHADAGAGCAAANFVVDFRWIVLVLSALMILLGLIAVLGANDPEIRDSLDLD